jgi:hypothetical protein
MIVWFDPNVDWAGHRHNYGGSQTGYYSTPFFEIDVGLEEPLIMALEMFDAEIGKINRQPFGFGHCMGRLADYFMGDVKGTFINRAREVEIWG